MKIYLIKLGAQKFSSLSNKILIFWYIWSHNRKTCLFLQIKLLITCFQEKNENSRKKIGTKRNFSIFKIFVLKFEIDKKKQLRNYYTWHIYYTIISFFGGRAYWMLKLCPAKAALCQNWYLCQFFNLKFEQFKTCVKMSVHLVLALGLKYSSKHTKGQTLKFQKKNDWFVFI